VPIKESAKKALRQSQKRRKRNLLRKKAIKDIRKKIRKLVEEEKFKEAKKLLPEFYKAVDKASKTFLHKNTAARRKSRMTKFIFQTEKKSKAQE